MTFFFFVFVFFFFLGNETESQNSFHFLFPFYSLCFTRQPNRPSKKEREKVNFRLGFFILNLKIQKQKAQPNIGKKKFKSWSSTLKIFGSDHARIVLVRSSHFSIKSKNIKNKKKKKRAKMLKEASKEH